MLSFHLLESSQCHPSSLSSIRFLLTGPRRVDHFVIGQQLLDWDRFKHISVRHSFIFLVYSFTPTFFIGGNRFFVIHYMQLLCIDKASTQTCSYQCQFGFIMPDCKWWCAWIDQCHRPIIVLFGYRQWYSCCLFFVLVCPLFTCLGRLCHRWASLSSRSSHIRELYSRSSLLLSRCRRALLVLGFRHLLCLSRLLFSSITLSFFDSFMFHLWFLDLSIVHCHFGHSLPFKEHPTQPLHISCDQDLLRCRIIHSKGISRVLLCVSDKDALNSLLIDFVRPNLLSLYDSCLTPYMHVINKCWELLVDVFVSSHHFAFAF